MHSYQMADQDDLRVCKSYDNFYAQLCDIRKSNSVLNKRTRPGETEIDVKTAFIRGAIISVMAIWEAYIQDLLEEAFQIVVERIESKGLVRMLKQEAPKKMVQKSIKRYLDEKHKLEGKSKIDVACAADFGIDLLANPVLWKKLLKEYNPLHLTPVFSGGDGIDQRFKGLLKTTRNLSEVILLQRPVHHEFV